MKKLNSMVLAIALASQSFAVSVDFYDEQQNNPSATGIRLRINNDSNVPINNAKLRYYFHRTSLPYVVDGYYIPNATLSTNNVNDTLAYLELDIPSVPAGYFPDIAGFSLALHNNDWSSRDKSRDYSYQTSSMLMENTKVVLLSGDNVLFGESPIAQTVLEPGILKISGLKFSDSAWLEIKNVGASTAALSDYRLVNANDSVFSLGNDSLAVNEVLRICQNQAACGEASKTLVNSVFGWDSIGEAILKKDSAMASYVAWGEPGFHAAAAVDAGVWTDSLEYFPAESHVQQYNADYIKNTFFRLRPNKSGMDTGDWFSFTSNDNPAKANSFPIIFTRTPKSKVKIISGENDVLFSWDYKNGIDLYRIIVYDSNNNEIYNLNTSSTSISLALTPGDYSWIVISEDEYLTSYLVSPPNIIYKNDLTIELSNITGPRKLLDIPIIKARRDTRMLNLLYGSQSYKFSWDKPNLDVAEYEPTEDGRCWVVAIEVMNHLYGGNLTQDEIAYKMKLVEGDPLLSPFFNEGNRFDDLDPTTLIYPKGNLGAALMWALHTDVLNYSKGTPSYATVKNAIDHDKPVFVGTSGHAMVIYGYAGTADNYAFYYAFIDNNGHISNSLNVDAKIIEYSIPEVTYGDVEMSDNRVHLDSDNDGITDFEEIERFLTNPYSVDSDNDGIEDKREIYNYTISREERKTHHAYNPYEEYRRDHEGYNTREKYRIYEMFDIFYNKADRNGNRILAELDPHDNLDFVDDGLCDNLGIPFSQKIEIMDIPGDYTIFGREYVAINDNVKCYNTQAESNSYCNIASLDNNIFSYDISYSPLSIGARAHVGNIDVRSKDFGNEFPGNHLGPILRSSSNIHENINLYAVDGLDIEIINQLIKEGYDYSTAKTLYFASLNPLDYISLQNGASVEGNVTLLYLNDWKKDFIYKYSTDMPSIPQSQTKLVQNGETYHLKDGDEFSSLTVQSGGTLIVEPGEMFVDKLLQIDANATIRFAEPGKGTVLHTNGQIIWHTYNSEPTSNTQYWINVAKGFKLAHHSSRKFYLEGMWAGTIYAPKAKVVLGQVTKTIYGRVLARDVVVHQFATVYRVDFNPTDALLVSYAF